MRISEPHPVGLPFSRLFVIGSVLLSLLASSPLFAGGQISDPTSVSYRFSGEVTYVESEFDEVFKTGDPLAGTFSVDNTPEIMQTSARLLLQQFQVDIGRDFSMATNRGYLLLANDFGGSDRLILSIFPRDSEILGYRMEEFRINIGNDIDNFDQFELPDQFVFSDTSDLSAIRFRSVSSTPPPIQFVLDDFSRIPEPSTFWQLLSLTVFCSISLWTRRQLS